VIWILISLCTCAVRYLSYNNCFANKATFAFHKVVQRHYSGEVGEFTIFWCKIFSWFCTPKIIIKIGSFFAELFKIWDAFYALCTGWSKIVRPYWIINESYYIILNLRIRLHFVARLKCQINTNDIVASWNYVFCVWPNLWRQSLCVTRNAAFLRQLP